MRFGFFCFLLLLSASFDPAAKADPVPFACTLQPDGRTVSVTIKNPFDRETSCQVNCQFSTPRAGSSFQISCTRTVQPGKETEICRKTDEKEALVKMTGGDGDCIKQLPLGGDKADPEDDNDALIKRMMKDSEDTNEHEPEK